MKQDAVTERVLFSLWLATCFASPARSAPPAIGLNQRVCESIAPIHVTRRPDGVFFIDFGRDAFANLELNLGTAGQNQSGRKIVIRLGEKLSSPDHLDSKPGASVRFLETSVTTEPGKSVYQAKLTKKDERLIPADIGAVMPFRYAELENLPDGITGEDLTARAVRQLALHYPFDDSAADFTCSDEKLNAIWNLCKYSEKATSFAGIFIDGDRERMPYEADAYIGQLGWYYCTDDTTLPRHASDYLITHATWPTEWIMFSVLTEWNNYLYCGDTASLKAIYPDLKAKTLRGLERADGLISTVSPKVPPSVSQAVHLGAKMKDIVDWPTGERDGNEMPPVNTVVNAFHCRSLILMATMAEAVGNSQDAAEFRTMAGHSLQSLNAKLVDAGTGLYVDGEGSHHSSLHANMFPLAFDLVPADRREKVAAYVQSRGMACSLYGAQFLMDSLFDNGRGPAALQLMEAPGERSWRHMVEDVGTTISLEAWDTKFKPNQDWNHIWGAAPANLLPRMVVGVEPLEPGYAKALIWPRSAGATAARAISWARGKVPTVKGPISVDWKQSADGFSIAIELPTGCTALVRLPADWGDQVWLDDTTTAGTKRSGTIDVEITAAGKHRLTVGR
jgi:alpha-L-rhamnosidase